MSRPFFYHGTTKILVAAFASLFNDIHIQKEIDDGNHTLALYKVPLRFSPKDKVLSVMREKPRPNDGTPFMANSPMIAYEIADINYAPDRATSQLNRMPGGMYNRVPYNFVFNMYITAKKLDHALQIMEQIVPFFSPSVNIQINQFVDNFKPTNIPLALNSVGLEIDYEGPASDNRNIIITMVFTMQAFYYRNETPGSVIKKTIMNVGDLQSEELWASLTSEVVPRTANKTDPYEIIDNEEILT